MCTPNPVNQQTALSVGALPGGRSLPPYITAGVQRHKTNAYGCPHTTTRHCPQSFSASEVWLLIVLLPGFGSAVCLLSGAGRVVPPGPARVRTGSDRAGLRLLSYR